MARVNLPPVQIPQKLLNDPDLRGYFEAQSFAIYQLWQRTGGGPDKIEIATEQIDINTENIAQNKENITLNTIAIIENTDNIQTNSDNIQDNADDISALQKTFSWKTIPANNEVTIDVNQQMIVADGIVIDGSIIVDGDLVLI